MILHLKHELGFDLTKETKIISIRPTYFSTFVFSFKKKKINSFFPCINFLQKLVKECLQVLNQKIKNIFLYFDNYLDYAKAKNVHSFSIARSIRYIVTKIRGHSLSYKCHCFKCLVCRLLMTELISREHLKLLLIVTARNYMFITNKFIFDSLEKKRNRGS